MHRGVGRERADRGLEAALRQSRGSNRGGALRAGPAWRAARSKFHAFAPRSIPPRRQIRRAPQTHEPAALACGRSRAYFHRPGPLAARHNPLVSGLTGVARRLGCTRTLGSAGPGLRRSERFQDLLREQLIHLAVPRNGLRLPGLGVVVDVVLRTMPQQSAAGLRKFGDQIAPLHATSSSATRRMPGISSEENSS